MSISAQTAQFGGAAAMLVRAARALADYLGQSYLPGGVGVIAATQLMTQECLMLLTGAAALLVHRRSAKDKALYTA